jgi:hypothetical protein
MSALCCLKGLERKTAVLKVHLLIGRRINSSEL